jgi:hypothetical protein
MLAGRKVLVSFDFISLIDKLLIVVEIENFKEILANE